ncbi:hypothetical protein [Ruminococcus flavefaciens]|uniref:hypothetical protein n=1 Tax=Ruminococcus flavefaciens TaxID=1265 RepID=UPI0025D69C63|nr:hypothetical protein [Ruminococcus flavefaciens]
MAVYSEKIADNDRKIEQLSKNIKRDTEKRKKLMEENARLSYQAICEQYNCTGQDLLASAGGDAPDKRSERCRYC